MAEHHCHARGCDVPVPPSMHMCKRHWFMVPKALRDALWAAYIPGQERRQTMPSEAYIEAALACRRAVAEREQTQPTASNNPNDVKWLDVADAIEESEQAQ